MPYWLSKGTETHAPGLPCANPNLELHKGPMNPCGKHRFHSPSSRPARWILTSRSTGRRESRESRVANRVSRLASGAGHMFTMRHFSSSRGTASWRLQSSSSCELDKVRLTVKSGQSNSGSILNRRQTKRNIVLVGYVFSE